MHVWPRVSELCNFTEPGCSSLTDLGNLRLNGTQAAQGCRPRNSAGQWCSVGLNGLTEGHNRRHPAQQVPAGTCRVRMAAYRAVSILTTPGDTMHCSHDPRQVLTWGALLPLHPRRVPGQVHCGPSVHSGPAAGACQDQRLRQSWGGGMEPALQLVAAPQRHSKMLECEATHPDLPQRQARSADDECALRAAAKALLSSHSAQLRRTGCSPALQLGRPLSRLMNLQRKAGRSKDFACSRSKH